jgi:hypothetical protein
MNTRRSLAAGLLFAAFSFAASGQSATGVISYIEGDVEVLRDGEYLNTRNVVIGLSIEEYDTVETGPDGYAEVEMDAPSAGSTIKIGPDSAFYFESTPRESSKFTTVFQLLRGSLGLKVGRLASNEEYGVRTDTAVMAVRGTEFSVDMATDRSVLITVPEGRVESKTDSQTITAEPGTIAAIDESSTMQAVAVEADDIDLYREYWRGLRLEALKINADLSIRQYAAQWERQLPRLEAAMEELTSHEDLFVKWQRIAAGELPMPSRGDIIRDKRTLSRGMIELRAILPVTERTFHTLVGLEDAVRRGFATSSLPIGNHRNATAFYRDFRTDKRKMQRILSSARRMVRIYRVLDRAGGSIEGLSTGPEIMSGPSF